MIELDQRESTTYRLLESEDGARRTPDLEVVSAEVPLVSVIIRSMNRTMLQDALDSIALQTYSNVEVVVVNATGDGHRSLGGTCGRFPLRLVDGAGPLTRSAAANLGMGSAKGKYLIFLDDDDYFLADHLEKLSNALELGSERACYTGVQLVDSDGRTILVLDEPWEADRLRAANFLPIHAVLFERSLLQEGCRFRDDLECLEDWEFWLQISALTAFRHIPQVSAVYRIGLGTSGLSAEADADKHLTNRARIFDAWLPRFTSRDWVRSIHWFENARSHFYQLALDRYHENRQLEAQVAASKASVALVQLELDAALEHAVSLRASIDRLNCQRTAAKELAARNGRLADAVQKHADALQNTIDALLSSTSWKLTGLLRFVSRIARGEHEQALESVRRRLFAIAKRMGIRVPLARVSALPLATTTAQEGGRAVNVLAASATSQSRMIDMEDVAPLGVSPEGRIAVHAHIFYPDIVSEFAGYLSHMPFAFDLFVSVPSEEIRLSCESQLVHLPNMRSLKSAVVVNRGRDVAPLLCTFGEELRHYDFLAHIHSKKSLYNEGATLGWREYLLDQLFGTPLQLRKIFALLSESSRIGIVYPQNFSKLPYWANTWLSNKPLAREWCRRLGIEEMPNGYFDYPAGSMFWARPKALQPLFEAGLTLDDFPIETGQQDATLAHCLERLFALTANRSGYDTAILRDEMSNRPSAWGFEQYLGQTEAGVRAVVSHHDVKVVIFDIFDTLLLRPLLNPKSIKTIVARQVGGDAGLGYAVLGPLVLSFVQWLAQQASADGIERLYFLSREGEFLKKVYDLWAQHTDGAPLSEYLVLSRRAVIVPTIQGTEDIEAIARTPYFENHASSFIWERYGVLLGNDEWSSLARQGLLAADLQVEVVDGQIDHLKPLLAALQSRIVAQAHAERPDLLAYLDMMGLNGSERSAVVDVGYSATIQGRLNQLLDAKVHGYYMMTDGRAKPIAERFDVTVLGCFGQYVQFTHDATAMLRQSFDLEKLLSSDEAQVIRYRLPVSEGPTPEFRAISRDEVLCQPVRAEIRKGAMQFVADAIETRENLLGDFVVPTSLSRQLYEVLVKQPSAREKALLREVVLDDYYCGRDLVR